MIILPAIDLLDGKCVRLYKGDYNKDEVVAKDALKTALSFKESGAAWLHMVDLNGAKDGGNANFSIIKQVAAGSGLKVETGGGIRDLTAIEKHLNAGVSRVILGSAALKNPGLVKEAVKQFSGESVAVGIDAKSGFVMTEGWLKSSKVHYLDLAAAMADMGVKYIIYTDIDKDGTLEGANLQQLKELSQKVNVNIIASGGVKDIGDIKAIKALNLYGAICGQSIYKGTLSLTEAISVAGVQI